MVKAKLVKMFTTLLFSAILIVGANSQLGGAPSPVPVDDPTVQNYAQLGVQQYSQESSSPNELVLVKIKSATVQIVAGTLHKIVVHIGSSNCEKGKKDNCEVNKAEGLTECTISVWTRAWINDGKPEITSTCAESKIMEKRQIPGGVNEVPVDDPEVKRYADLGFQKYVTQSTSSNEPILVRIKSATVQVVAGTLHKIVIHVGDSTCEKGKKDTCQLQNDKEVTECLISVWSRPWLDKGNPEITITCSEKKVKNE